MDMERKDSKGAATKPATAGPGQCLLGSAIAGALALPLYWLSQSIAQGFADKPIASTNPTAINISIAVRTLVTGGCILMTAVFAIAAVGLLLLAGQMLLQGSQERA